MADPVAQNGASEEGPDPSVRDGDATTEAPAGATTAADDPPAEPTPTAGPPAEPERPRTLEQALDMIDDLREQLLAKTDEATETYDRLLRERAELENFKKRMHREKVEALRYATEPLLRDLLPVVDNIELAIQAAKAAGDQPGARQIEALLTGVEMVLHQFTEVLERHGVNRVSSVGEPFDPSRHEAVAHVESDEAAPGAVLEQYRAGYRLHDRLLRPAQVSVAKARSSGSTS